MTKVGENGAVSGVGLLATFAYDDLGQRTSLTRAGGAGAQTTYGYDSASRITALVQNPAATAYDQTYGFAWTPASQLRTRTDTNLLYRWAPPVGTASNAYDGLNRDAAIVAMGSNCTLSTAGYDCRGNLRNDGTRHFEYDVENRLTSVVGGAGLTLAYDPIGRLKSTVSGSTTTQFLYDGSRLSAEYNASGTVLRRYVHGPGVDEPLVWYEGAGTTDRRWLHHDRQGSVIAWSNSSGTVVASGVYTYGPWGEPGDNWAAGASRFRYTGQIALPEVGLYHYKARVYDPIAGRFLQTDPIGYQDDLNLYAYVGGDPISRTDPLGLAGTPGCGGPGESECPPSKTDREGEVDPVVIEGKRPQCDRRCNYTPAQRWFETQHREPNLERNGWMVEIALAPTMLIEAPVAFGGFLAKLCNCFEEGTLVATADGDRPIETIAVGDLVLSRDEQTGQTGFKPVLALIRGSEREIWDVIVEVSDGDGRVRLETIHTTEEHPFRTLLGAWTPAAQLGIGDLVLTATDDLAKVVSVESSGRITRTYNFEVADFHTYFVGQGRVWVHNACSDLVKAARALGFRLDKGFGRMHGQDVFKNGNRYITRDVDKHSGGFWKMFDRKGNRLGTYNKDLTTRIGD